MADSADAPLRARLEDPSLLETRSFIAGEWVTADDDARFPVTNPATGEVIATVPDLGLDETRRAIEAAEAARHEWAGRTGKERAAILRRWFELMVENADDLAVILTAEAGKPIGESRGEILYGAAFVEFFAEEAKRVYGETIPGHQPDKRLIVIRQPVGVAAGITPWNFPNAMIARKVAPALAAGCGFVIKPAEETPLSALAMAVLAERAGIPGGLFSVVTTSRPALVGEEFCTNETVRKITFTGSTEVGRILLRLSADQIKRVSLELGGNAPFIVFDDADLEEAVEGAMMSKYRNTGQTCVCANRIYVQEGIYDAFAERLAEKVRQVQVGDPFDPATNAGPLINEAAVAKVERHVADAVAKGARVLVGGTRLDREGPWFAPTVICDVSQEMQVAREETFGPLAPLFRFSEEAEVIRQANDTIYGLAAYFYARDLSRVWRVAEALEYGMVGINTGIISTELAPFGGVKQSGLGREGSRHGIEEYLEMKYLCMAV